MLLLVIASRVQFRDDIQRIARGSRICGLTRGGLVKDSRLEAHDDTRELPSWDLHGTREILAVADGRIRTPVRIDGGVLAIARQCPAIDRTPPGSVFRTTAAIDSHDGSLVPFCCQQYHLRCSVSPDSIIIAKMPKVHLLDYVAGNVRSLVNAIEKNGYEVEWVRSPEEVANAEVWIWIAEDWRSHAPGI